MAIVGKTPSARRAGRPFRDLLRLAALAAVLLGGSAWALDRLVLGVFAYRPAAVLVPRYQPLADYLSAQLGDTRVELRVLTQDEIERALERNELDLVFTNPSHYIVLRTHFRLTGALATLISLESGQAASRLGGVIIAPGGSERPRGLDDLANVRIAVPGRKYLGGYLAQMYEILESGAPLPAPARLAVAGSHDAVVAAVLEGRADAGFIRSGMLEQLQREGRLQAGRLRVVNPLSHPGFPFAASTRLYPEWAFVALPHVDSWRVRRIASSLMLLPADHPVARAAGIGGFAPPADYLPAENVMRTLRSPPFDKAAPITWRDIWSQHRISVLVVLALLSLVAIMVFFLVRQNRALRQGSQALKEARVAAEAANRTKSEFLATMSHEIRTPMNGVLGMAQLLLADRVSDEERRSHALTILNSGQVLLTLLNDILDLSKVEAGKLELEAIAFDARSLLAETTQLFRETARSKGVSLDCRWAGSGDACYRGDPVRIRQMLANLVSNALKFTERGFVRVEACEIGRQGSGARLEFSVADSGIGVPAAQLGLLFRPFSQGDSSTTRRFGGTGLGLSIVRRLAELMGGEVGVESEAGAGARFWFRIAVAVAGRDELAAARAAVPAPLEGAGSLARVLVVEDNPTNRKVIELMLRKQGLAVDCVCDGQAAVDALAAGSPVDLVLMDCQMPVMDGFEATARIRRREEECGLPRLPIVALTAGAFQEDRERCLAAGMDDYLSKPVDIGALLAVLQKWGGGPAAAD